MLQRVPFIVASSQDRAELSYPPAVWMSSFLCVDVGGLSPKSCEPAEARHLNVMTDGRGCVYR